MPTYEVELSDGRIVDIEGDKQPTESDVMGLLSPQQSMPPIPISPYDKYKLGGGEPSGPFGPANPQEVLALPDILKVPAAAIDRSGIPQSLEEIGADFLNRTGINPAAQAGVPLPPPPDQQGAVPPSPFEEAFPNVASGLEASARQFFTPGTVMAAPFAELKPVQAAFEAQMASGVPQAVEDVATAPTTQERTQAASQAIMGILAGAHGLLPRAAKELIKSTESEVPDASQIGKTEALHGDVRPQQEPTEVLSKQEGVGGVQPQAEPLPQTQVGVTPEVPLEQAPPTAPTGEVPQQAPSEVAAKVGEVAPSPTEPAKAEGGTTPPEAQPGSVTKDVTDKPLVGMGGAVPGEFDRTGSPTAMKYAKIDEERQKRGLEPLTKPEGTTDQATLDKAMAAIDQDPSLPDKLVEELNNKPRAIEDWENHVLMLRKIDLKNEYDRSADEALQAYDDSKEFPGRLDDMVRANARTAEASDKLQALETASRFSGSARGRALRSLQVMLNEDYSLASMETKARVSKGGGRITDDERAALKEQHDLIQKKLADAEKATLAAQVDAAMARAQLETAKPAYHPKIIETAKKIVGRLDERADAARARLKEKFSRTSAGVDPTILKDVAEIGAAHLAHNIVDFAEWSNKLVREFGENVKPYLQRAFAMAKESIDKLDVPAPVKRIIAEGTPEEQKQGIRDAIKNKLGDKDKDIAFYVQKLARHLYQEGAKTRESLLKALHAELKKVMPDITERQTADAFSGYGDFKQLGKDEVTVALRGMKGELQQLSKLEDMAKGQPPLKSGFERRIPTDSEKELIKKVNDAKFKFQIPISDPETQLKSALDTLKSTLETRIKDYTRRLTEGDFAPKVRRELVLDNDARRLKAEAEQAKNAFQRGLEANRKANRSTWQKALDKFVRVERFFKLSSPVVFGKLLGAAFARAVTTATEEFVGGALSKVPGISEVARQAPREGGLNVKAMAQGLSDALSKEALRQSRKKATTGETDIETLYSKKGAKDTDWTNIMGQLHGALKTPVLLGEFRLSLEKRLENAIKNKVDVSSPEVLTRIQAEAMDDAYRSIFMQRGFTSDLFNTTLNMAEKSKKYPISGEVFARAARFLLPVVRVPLNIVGETATGVAGTPVASTRLMFHAIKGTLDTLDPKVADSIMRQFKKGSIGLGLVAIGYFNPQSIGGFDYREKRKPGAVKTAGFKVGGHDIPRWATHAPWFELMQIGATIRHVQDQHTKTGTKGISEGMWAAAWGLIEQTPFFDQMTRWARASESAPARTRLLGELAKSTVVPQAVSQVAELTDPRKVKPKTIGQYVESGIPGLRGNVSDKTKQTDSIYK